MEGREETELLKLHEDWDCRRGSRITRRTHASGPETERRARPTRRCAGRRLRSPACGSTLASALCACF